MEPQGSRKGFFSPSFCSISHHKLIRRGWPQWPTSQASHLGKEGRKVCHTDAFGTYPSDAQKHCSPAESVRQKIGRPLLMCVWPIMHFAVAGLVSISIKSPELWSDLTLVTRPHNLNSTRYCRLSNDGWRVKSFFFSSRDIYRKKHVLALSTNVWGSSENDILYSLKSRPTPAPVTR